MEKEQKEDNVVELKTNKTDQWDEEAKENCNIILEEAAKNNFTDLTLVGITSDNKIVVLNSNKDIRDMLYMMELAKSSVFAGSTQE